MSELEEDSRWVEGTSRLACTSELEADDGICRHGPLGPQYGMAVDNILQYSIVVNSGSGAQLVKANACTVSRPSTYLGS